MLTERTRRKTDRLQAENGAKRKPAMLGGDVDAKNNYKERR
jgi:hypothetical protein